MSAFTKGWAQNLPSTQSLDLHQNLFIAIAVSVPRYHQRSSRNAYNSANAPQTSYQTEIPRRQWGCGCALACARGEIESYVLSPAKHEGHNRSYLLTAALALALLNRPGISAKIWSSSIPCMSMKTMRVELSTPLRQLVAQVWIEAKQVSSARADTTKPAGVHAGFCDGGGTVMATTSTYQRAEPHGAGPTPEHVEYK